MSNKIQVINAIEELASLASDHPSMPSDIWGKSSQIFEYIRSLEEALEPFAREAAEWDELCKDSDIPKICGPADPCDLYDAAFDLGDLRRAAELVSENG